MENLNSKIDDLKRLEEKIIFEIKENKLLVDENIFVDIDGNEIILYGDVDDNDKKWLVEDIVNSIISTGRIKNQIKVVDTRTYW